MTGVQTCALPIYIAQVVLHDFKAQWVKVSVAKINHMRGVQMVGVTIARRRDDANARTIQGANDGTLA